MKILIYRSKQDRLWYFRIIARNGKIIAQGEGYQRIGSTEKTVASIQKSIGRAPVRVSEKEL